jgi:hypothetical protein
MSPVLPLLTSSYTFLLMHFAYALSSFSLLRQQQSFLPFSHSVLPILDFAVHFLPGKNWVEAALSTPHHNPMAVRQRDADKETCLH